MHMYVCMYVHARTLQPPPPLLRYLFRDSLIQADFCKRGRIYLNPDPGHGATHQGFTFNDVSLFLSSGGGGAGGGHIVSSFCDSLLYQCAIAPSNGSVVHGGACDDPEAGGWTQDFAP